MAKLLCCILLYLACSVNEVVHALPSGDTAIATGNKAQKIKADTSTAILARHHIYAGTEVIAQLGYIDTNIATRKEIADNWLLGLVALPGDEYEIVSFSFSGMSLHSDIVGPLTIKGCKMRLNIANDFRAGDKLFIDDINARRKGTNHTFKIQKGITITVTE